MKILFNCSVNTIGGAVQNAANFIRYAIGCKEHMFIFVVSPQVESVLHAWGIDNEFIFCMASPSSSKDTIASILNIEKKFSPDIVFTMAGPTYIPFKSYHVMGISDPYITHADSVAYRLNRSTLEAVFFLFKEMAKGVISRFSANYFIFQTETSKKGFCKRFFWPSNKTAVVSNAIGEDFFINSFQSLSEKNDFENKVFTVFVPSAYYPHKNLEIIFDICEIIMDRGLEDIRFITTADGGGKFNSLINMRNLRGLIENVGPYSYADALEYYNIADCVFIPSILETFSTSYLEAVALCKPLVVADKAFAREVCMDYAYYFKPLSAESALDAILNSIKGRCNYTARDSIVSKYGTQQDRFYSLVSVLENLFQNRK